MSTQLFDKARESEHADVVALVEAVLNGKLTEPAEIATRCDAVGMSVDDLETLVNGETERWKAEKFRDEADALDKDRPTLEREFTKREAERGAEDRKHQERMRQHKAGEAAVADQISKSRERAEQCRNYSQGVLGKTPTLPVAIQLLRLRESRLPLVERANTLTERLKASRPGSEDALRIQAELTETERALTEIDARISHLTPTV